MRDFLVLAGGMFVILMVAYFAFGITVPWWLCVVFGLIAGIVQSIAVDLTKGDSQ